jgi:hypothetical protein
MNLAQRAPNARLPFYGNNNELAVPDRDQLPRHDAAHAGLQTDHDPILFEAPL